MLTEHHVVLRVPYAEMHKCSIREFSNSCKDMGKRSTAARNQRRRIKRRFARQKAKVHCIKDTRGNFTQPETQPSSAQSTEEIETPYSDFSASPNSTESDIDRWSASSPPSSNEDDTDMGIEPAKEGTSIASCVWKATEEEFPMIVEDRSRSIQVHLSPDLDYFRGSDVLKLSTKEYFRRIQQRESQKNLAIKCLRNKVEELNKELVSKEHTLRKEKEEAVSRVRSFWRDNLLEGRSHGGRMVRAALQRSVQS